MTMLAYALALVACLIVTILTGWLSAFVVGISNLVVSGALMMIGAKGRIGDDSMQAMLMVFATVSGFFWGVLIRLAQTLTILFVMSKFAVQVSPILALLFLGLTVLNWKQLLRTPAGLGINLGLLVGVGVMYPAFDGIQL